MGIFSKFQIKDIKSKILGGKVKHKPDVPAIAVSPPTPSVKNDFSFLEGEEVAGNIDSGKVSAEDSRGSKPSNLSRQRSLSLPESLDKGIIVDWQIAGLNNEIVKSYLKPPKSGRRRRKNRKRTASCPGNLTDFQFLGQDVARSPDGGNVDPSPTGPIDDVSGYYTFDCSKISREKPPHLKAECQEFNFADDAQERKLSGDDFAENNCLENDSIERLTSHGRDVSRSMEASPSASSKELSNFSETASLCLSSDQQSEISEASGHTYLKEKTQRRVVNAERKKPETRWSLDLDKLRCASGSENSLGSNDSDMKWDGQSPGVSSNGKNLVSTWSLDLEKAFEKDKNIGRAYSEINFSGSPHQRDGPKSILGEQVMFNAKSLDLEFVKQPVADGAKITSDRTLGQPVLKRGISDYVGKFNGIVSKFSTWSLDIELNRKRSLEGELDDTNRAQSELALGANTKDGKNKGRSVSYHSLLYDFDEASRYQIYQPTVYEIGDETPGENPEKAVTHPKQASYGSSIKYISKQFESLYENGKSIYKHRQKMLTDAIKQREKELKAIADREAKAKQAQNSEKPQAEPFFKPKPPPRRHSTTRRKHVKQATIIQGGMQ